MPRCARQLVTGEAYHLTSRGTDRREVFLDDEDRQRFVIRLGAVCRKRDVSCLAYCLMGNHVHLLVRGDAPAMSDLMRDLLGGHAQFFNRRHGRTGHLFGSRYHDVHIASDAQLDAALRYVALNPVRAGLTPTPEAWPWSSYAALAAGVLHPGALDVDQLMSLLPLAERSVPALRDHLETVVHAGMAEARMAAVART